jgi:cation:H+ antiporter
MTSALILIAGFALLIKGASMLVEGASSIARAARISDLAIALTVVAFGTSLPELFVNITASSAGNSAIAISNITGSNIANILLILGISAVIFPLEVTKGTVWKEIPFSLLAGVVLFVFANKVLTDKETISTLSRSEGVVLLLFFIIFLYYTAGIAKQSTGLGEKNKIKILKPVKAGVFIIIGLLMLAGGGSMAVSGAIGIAKLLGLSESFVGLTIVAIGTSLPELSTSAVAALKKNPEIAVGNVVGSNIFNIFFILGVSALIREHPIEAELHSSLVMTVLSSGLLFVFMFTGKRRVIDRWEGFLMLVMYAAYLSFASSV